MEGRGEEGGIGSRDWRRRCKGNTSMLQVEDGEEQVWKEKRIQKDDCWRMAKGETGKGKEEVN